MGFLIWLIIGGVVGWLASLVMRTDGQQGILLNIVVGIVGAFLGGLLISPLVGVGTINDGVSIGSLRCSISSRMSCTTSSRRADWSCSRIRRSATPTTSR